MSSFRETFILKIVKHDEEEQPKVSLTLRNIKSEKSLLFNSTEELARYLELGDTTTQTQIIDQ